MEAAAAALCSITPATNGGQTSSGDGFRNLVERRQQCVSNVPDHTLTMGYIDNGGTATATITKPSDATHEQRLWRRRVRLSDTPNRGGTYSIRRTD